MTDAEQKRHLRRIWNEVVTDNPSKSEDWCRWEALRIFNNSYTDYATNSDLTEALESAGDVFR